MTMNKLISIGKIVNFHGIKGEVKMGFTSGKESLIRSLKKVFIFVDDKKETFDVESVRFHKNFAIVKLNGINSINDVMRIKGLLVHVNEETLKNSLDVDEFLINDLIGLDVFDTEGQKVGVVSEIGDNRASNLIEIKKNNGLKFLVPFVKEWIPVVDIDAKRIVVKMTNGIDTSVESAEN